MISDNNRTPATTVEEVMAFDLEEVVDGYRDGRSGDPEPGDNRSKAYWHGWRNGRGDLMGTADPAQRELARNFIANGMPIHPAFKK